MRLMKYRPLSLRCALALPLLAASLLVSPDSLRAQSTVSLISEITPVYRVPGVAMPDKQVTLGAAQDAMILSINVEEEDRVTTGELLAQMDDRVQLQVVAAARVEAEATAALIAAESRLNVATLELEKTQLAYDKQATTQQELEIATGRVEETKAELQAAKDTQMVNIVRLKLEEARLEETRIRAPFDGIILDKVAEAGDVLRSSDDILVLINIDTIKVELPIPVTVDKEVIKGKKYELIAGAPLNKIIVAECTRIASMLNVSGQSNTYEFSIDNPEQKIRPGFHVWLKSLDPVE